VRESCLRQRPRLGHGEAPHLGKRLLRVCRQLGQREHLAQSRGERATLGVQPAGYGIGRARAELRPNFLDLRPLAAGLAEGAMFRRLWKDRVGPALSPAAVGELAQRRARLADLEGDFGGHSLRSGFVTEASHQGVALPAIMAKTEHRVVSSVVGYFQTGSAASNPAARLLED